MDSNKRGQWGSNLGFLLASVGSAIGLGNLWAFPYKMGKSGGFAFLAIYLVLVVLVGIVLMLGEFALGRHTGHGAGGAYAALAKRYSFVGWMAVISPFLILGFYCVLGGMVLRYCLGFLVQIFGADGFAGQGSSFFGWLLYSPVSMLLFLVIFLAITMFIVMGGVKGGIERFSKAVMPALAVILVVIIVFVAVQPGAVEGYKFMFLPNPEVLATPEDFFEVLKTASGQMFFSLSVGMGINITFGSYLSKDRSLQRNAVIVPVADTVFALLAGMMILPACAAFGVDYAQGPGLLFASMQNVFLDGMGGMAGNVIGFLFYFLVFIAAITSSIALLEVCTAFIVDKQLDKGQEPKRRTVTGIFGILVFLIAIPVSLDALGSGDAAIKAPFELMGLSEASAMWNDCWLDFYDMITEGLLMPIGALFMSIILGWLLPKLVKEECETSGHKFRGETYFKVCFRFVVPAVMLLVLGTQIKSFFF